MSRADSVKEIVEEIVGHLDTAGDLAEITEKVLSSLDEKLPSAQVAGILTSAGGWLKVALSPISVAMSASTDKWFEKQVAFIKKESGVEKISEETALALVRIRMVQIRERTESFKQGLKDSESSSKSK